MACSWAIRPTNSNPQAPQAPLELKFLELSTECDKDLVEVEACTPDAPGTRAISGSLGGKKLKRQSLQAKGAEGAEEAEGLRSTKGKVASAKAWSFGSLFWG
mmetsp:Transcript_31268/g.48985  ORF Transcript_31268/g.48985 Transcript_31268/m.48985 type:complete len:102 (+) Transcript_31268:4480-4785(+)